MEEREYIEVEFREVEEFECPYCDRKKKETLVVYLLGSDNYAERYEWGIWCNCGSVFHYSKEKGLLIVIDGRCKICGELDITFQQSEIYGKEEEFLKDVRCMECSTLLYEYHIEEKEEEQTIEEFFMSRHMKL